MNDQPQSPWTPPPPRPRPSMRRPPLSGAQRGWLLLILFAVLGGAWALSQLMPGRFTWDADWPQATSLAMMTAIVAAAVVRLRLRPREAVRNILLWVVIFALLGVGYTLWVQFQAGQHAAPPVHAQPPPAGAKTEQASLASPAATPPL